ncbi:MAG TPA: C40 family peptidase [Gemmatimonadales bacterium]
MKVIPAARLATLLGVLGGSVSAAAQAQGPTFEAGYGFWWTGDSTSVVFSAGYTRRLFGPFGYGIGFTHLDNTRSIDDRTLSGAELSLSMFRDGSGPYLIGSAAVGIRHVGGGIDGAWSAGGGYAVRPFSGFSLGLEGRYRVEDSGMYGFWRLGPDDRRGIQLTGRVAIGLGGSPSRAAHPPAVATNPARPSAPPSRLPSTNDIHDLARDAGASETGARLTTSVVETALKVMGLPYQWGGSDENGFDCSGLIHYAYGQHGIIMPRISRDQMRMGKALDKRVAALAPGDLIGFSIEGTSRITHIGLYIGGGQFIHSASGGVKLSSLTATDPDSRWWQQRWVSARRIVD